MGLCHELIVLSQAELWWGYAGFAPPRVFRSLTQLARPGSTDPDPESNRASRRGLLGEAGGQSGKEVPCGFGSCWQRFQGKRLICLAWERCCLYSSREVQQQPFPLGKEGISLCWWHTWCCVWQGLPLEVPDAPANHQSSPFSSLALKTEVFICLDQ